MIKALNTEDIFGTLAHQKKSLEDAIANIDFALETWGICFSRDAYHLMSEYKKTLEGQLNEYGVDDLRWMIGTDIDYE